MSTFVIGKDYSREEIHTVCGGNKQSFLPMHHGKIAAACLKPERNPQAPDVIICSTGAAQRAAGRTLARQQEAIPVFIRQDSQRWRFMGQFQVAESLTAPPDCAKHAIGSGYKAVQVSRILKLRPL